MNLWLIVITFSVLFLVPFSSQYAEALTVFVSIPAGTAAPGCELNIPSTCYVPNQITINVGDEVTWTNNDAFAHTVVSGSGGVPDLIFNSALFLPTFSFSNTFNNPGTFPYFCQIHPWATGTVNVQSVIGGEIIPIEQTSLLLAGAQSFSWMIPVTLSVLGIGLFVFRKSENS